MDTSQSRNTEYNTKECKYTLFKAILRSFSLWLVAVLLNITSKSVSIYTPPLSEKKICCTLKYAFNITLCNYQQGGKIIWVQRDNDGRQCQRKRLPILCT